MWKKENLRKNFLRVKQIADQNFGRAEKSEVLTEDQQGNEKRVEAVRQVCHNVTKKVTALLEAPPGTDVEKRLKKLPETSLNHTLMEAAAMLGTDTLLGNICQQCGECQSALAREELQCELDIEREVITPLQTIAEVDIPSIMKHRKQLNKSTLDMDSAKNRFNSAIRQSHVPGANMASAAAKADAVRDEYDEACNKVESIKDNLSIELCTFVSKESEHSSRLVALLEAQAAYHKKALKVIEEMIPKMKATIEASPAKPVFGMQLEEHLRIMDRDICVVLEASILTLLETGMEEEGLFRIAGSALKMKKLKACFDAHAVDMEEFVTDPHTVAGVMKQYLRELPEPMLTFNLHQEFMHAATLSGDAKYQALYTAVNKLPTCNYNNMRYLVKFLALLKEKSHINKMTPSNIAIVMGPNLLWAEGESTPNMMTAAAVSAIIEAFIIQSEYFFPGELDFHLTGRGRAPPSPSTLSSPIASETPGNSETDKPQETVKTLKDDVPIPKEVVQAVESSSPPLQPQISSKEQSENPNAARLNRSLRDDAGSESREEEMMAAYSGGSRGAGDDGGMSAQYGDGITCTLAPHTTTNLSLTCSLARQRPTMSVPSLLTSTASPYSPSIISHPVSGSSPHLDSDQEGRLSAGRPAPTSPVDPGQSVHSDMYSTLFALHSLTEGEGAVYSDYITRVRALWDGRFQSSTLAPPPPPLPSPVDGQVDRWALSSKKVEGIAVVRPEKQAFSPSPNCIPSSSPSSETTRRAALEQGQRAEASVDDDERCRAHGPNPKGSQAMHSDGHQGMHHAEIDFAMTGGYPPDSPAQEYLNESTSAMLAASPPYPSHSPNPSSGSPVSSNSSLIHDTLSPTADLPEVSPKVQRRVTKKPAPPPPPDRPYSVAMTGSLPRGTGNGGLASHPSQRNAPVASPDIAADVGSHGETDRRPSPPDRRSMYQERPHFPPPERPSGPPPERPKPPVLAAPSVAQPPPAGSGHQRSASTGAMYINTTAATSNNNGSQDSHQAGGAGNSLSVGQGNALPSGTATLGRHSTMRPARPNPPPPPPPINQQTEETHL